MRLVVPSDRCALATTENHTISRRKRRQLKKAVLLLPIANLACCCLEQLIPSPPPPWLRSSLAPAQKLIQTLTQPGKKTSPYITQQISVKLTTADFLSKLADKTSVCRYRNVKCWYINKRFAISGIIFSVLSITVFVILAYFYIGLIRKKTCSYACSILSVFVCKKVRLFCM